MPRTAPSSVVTIGPLPWAEAAAAGPALAAVAPVAARVSAASAAQQAASKVRRERVAFMIVTPSRTCGPPEVETGLATRWVACPQLPSSCGPSHPWISLGFPWVSSLGPGREEPHRAALPMLSSGFSGDPTVLGQRRSELPARGDAELREHVAQVPFDRARADEQLGADLRVRQAVVGEPGDLPFLGRELVARVGAALAHLLARCHQLPAGALGEGLHPDPGEQVVGRTQLLARVDAAALAAQPLPVEQMRAGKLRADFGAAEPLDRTAIQEIRVVAAGQQRL